jgi:hypothetical protein
MLNVLSLMTTRQTIMYNTLFSICKIKNKILRQYLYSKIMFISDRQNYNLRNCRDFDIRVHIQGDLREIMSPTE